MQRRFAFWLEGYKVALLILEKKIEEKTKKEGQEPDLSLIEFQVSFTNFYMKLQGFRNPKPRYILVFRVPGIFAFLPYDFQVLENL